MKEGRFSIKEIADMTGFESNTYFGKVFKTEKGVTPGEYINSLKKSKLTSSEE